jgi:TRAP-type mannitol/chloroaromatic compound transport system permease small subunit
MTTAADRRPGPVMAVALAFQRGMDRVSDLLGGFSAYLAIILIVVGFANVALRYIGEAIGRRLTTNDVIEAQWYLYGMLFLLALPYVLRHHINVRVDFWFTNQPARRKAWIDFVGHLLGLLPFAMLGIYISWPAVRTSWRISETTPEGGLPLAPIKTMILVAMILLLLQGLAEIVKLVAVLHGWDDQVAIEESEAPLRVE